MNERGSAKLLRERVLPQDELDRLWQIIDEEPDAELQWWWERGQPGPDAVGGTVRITSASVGGILQRLTEFERLRVRLDVFPLGIPRPDEFLVRFEHANGPA